MTNIWRCFNLKKNRNYKKPIALVTNFECADIITTSETRALYTKPDNAGETTYIKAGGLKWNENFKK